MTKIEKERLEQARDVARALREELTTEGPDHHGLYLAAKDHQPGFLTVTFTTQDPLVAKLAYRQLATLAKWYGK